MILANREILWTPMVGRGGVAVALDRTFADACIAHKMQDLKTFSDKVWNLMNFRPPIEKPSNFLNMYDGVLPKGFYAGHDGLWLTVDMSTISSASPDRPVIYHGHNEDRHAADRLWLLQAFGAWASVAIIVLDWK